MAIAIDNKIKNITKAEFNGTNLAKIYCDDVLVWSYKLTYTGKILSAEPFSNCLKEGHYLLTLTADDSNKILDSFSGDFIYTLKWGFRKGTTSTLSNVNITITPYVTDGVNTVSFEPYTLNDKDKEANINNNNVSEEIMQTTPNLNRLKTSTIPSDNNNSYPIWIGTKPSITLGFTFSGDNTNANFFGFRDMTATNSSHISKPTLIITPAT
jgi:hypothetical protein